MRGMKLKDLIAQFVDRGLSQPEVEQSHRRGPRPLPSNIRKATGNPIRALTNAEIEQIFLEEDASH